MIRNLPSLEDITSGTDLRHLDLEEIEAVLAECERTSKLSSAAKKAIVAHLETRFAGAIEAAYEQNAKDFGTIHVIDGAFDVEVSTPKKVEWDQKALHAICVEISEAGDDPREFVNVEYSIEEKKFTAWPGFLQTKFAPARVLKKGSRTVKLSRVKSEAA